MMRSGGKATFDAGDVSFVVRHELWDGNIQDHSDQGVSIRVMSQVGGNDKEVLRFNCFDVERSYVYDPDGKCQLFRMDPTVDGNPIGWSVRQLKSNLPAMLQRAGYDQVAARVNTRLVAKKLPEIEATAREMFMTGRNTVKHNRGTDIFEAGNVRFGLEMRTVREDGGLAIHVLADLVGAKGQAYTEETEILAFDCFRVGPHYHYGPRNKNHRIYWDKTLVPDPLGWTLEQFKNGKLPDMIERAGYPGVVQELDEGLIATVLPKMAARARQMVIEDPR
jgi:hypothetical protein